jgi:hypothetical protein
MALSKSLLLGEALPSLRLVFQDSHGNVVPVGDEVQPSVTLQVLEAGPGNGGAVLQELQAEAELVSTSTLSLIAASVACRGICAEAAGYRKQLACCCLCTSLGSALLNGGCHTFYGIMCCRLRSRMASLCRTSG